jgi:hypothetical protein
LDEELNIRGDKYVVFDEYLVISAKYHGEAGTVYLLKNDEPYITLAMEWPNSKFGDFIWIGTDSGSDLVLAVAYERSDGAEAVNLYKF